MCDISVRRPVKKSTLLRTTTAPLVNVEESNATQLTHWQNKGEI